MRSAIILTLFIVLSATIILTQKYKRQNVNILQASAMNTTFTNNSIGIENLENKLKSGPNNLKIMKQLGFAYIKKARETGDFILYDEKALSLFNKILSNDAKDFEALIGKATVQLSQHNFTDAIETGKKAKEINSYNSAAYGILTDGYVETGDYTKAIECADKMNSIRPDLRSYSRISYLREIHGNYPGAIEAMQMAVSAGIDGTEETEWARYQLGCLFEKTGELSAADFQFLKTISYRPTFMYAFLGHGRILQKEKNYSQAEKYYQYASTLSKDYQPAMSLSRLFREQNKQDEAAIQIRKAIEKLTFTTVDNGKQGHYAGKELSELYLESFDYLPALDNAILEYNKRPDNIDVNHVLAWTYYKIGNYDKALIHIEKALRTNSNDSELLIHAGLIYKKKGFENIGNARIKKALTVNSVPGFPVKAEI